MIRFGRWFWTVASSVSALTRVLELALAVSLMIASSGCIHEDGVVGDQSSTYPADLANLTDLQNEIIEHLKEITASQNRAISAYNDREYAECQEECERMGLQNEEYASSVESFAGLVADARLTESDQEYYEAQIEILRAVRRNIGKSASDLYLACGYAFEGDYESERYHIQNVTAYLGAFYDNIDRFNKNIDTRNEGTGNFVSPAPDPPDLPDLRNMTATATATTTTSDEIDLADIPDPYYLEKPRFQNTRDEVKRLLGKGFITPYSCSVFDCSEMAAYIEWKLECHNITAYIATRNNWQGGYGHAWVIVPLRGGSKLAIEPTISAAEGSVGAEMITTDPKYFTHDHLFEDIYEASEFFGVEEWDWWNKLEIG